MVSNDVMMQTLIEESGAVVVLHKFYLKYFYFSIHNKFL